MIHTTPNSVFTPPAFIVGVPRSGTTLLASILNRNSQVCVTPETHYYSCFHNRVGHESFLNANWPASVRRCLYSLNGLREMRLSFEDIIDAAYSRKTRAGLLSSIGELYAAKHGKRLWIEKTPQHMLYLPEILNDFPQARIINILRDGRDVALSLSQVDWANPGFLHNLHQWSEELEAAEPHVSNNPHCLTIRYEDLLSTPEATVAKVCGFLGIEYEEKMLKPDGSEERLIEIGMTHKDNIRQSIITNNKGKWATKVSSELAVVADHFFGEAIIRQGYERTPSQLNQLMTREIVMPRQMFFQDIPQDVRISPLGDFEAERLARNGWSITLAKNLNCLMNAGVNTFCVICSNNMPRLGAQLRSRYWQLALLLEWRLRLRELRQRGVTILWLRESTRLQQQDTLIQKYADQLFEKYAYAHVRLHHHNIDGIVVGSDEFFQLLDGTGCVTPT